LLESPMYFSGNLGINLPYDDMMFYELTTALSLDAVWLLRSAT
jgi:hypothetical protein